MRSAISFENGTLIANTVLTNPNHLPFREKIGILQMLFAERLKALKDRGIDNASAILEYTDGAKQAIANASDFADISSALNAISVDSTGLKTKIIQRTNPTAADKKNLTIITLDTRAAKNRELITDMALDLNSNILSIDRAALLARKKAPASESVHVGVTQGNTIKLIPIRPQNDTNWLRANSGATGERLRSKIDQCLLAGRPAQLLTDEIDLFNNIATSRRLALSEFGLKLDGGGKIKMRSGDGFSDLLGMYLDMLEVKEHTKMFRSLAHFARVEPVFVTPRSSREEFRQWYQILSEYRYDSDPRVLRGLASAGVLVERKTLTLAFPGDLVAKPTPGFYFHVSPPEQQNEVQFTPGLEDVPNPLLVALAQRHGTVPDDPAVCRYLMLDGVLQYLWENVLGPRGATFGPFRPQLNIHMRLGVPYFVTPVRLEYGAIDYSHFPQMYGCFQPTRVVSQLLKKIRESQHSDRRSNRDVGNADLVRIINDVALSLSGAKIDVAHVFNEPEVLKETHFQRKIDRAMAICHRDSCESEYLSVVKTALTNVLAGLAVR